MTHKPRILFILHLPGPVHGASLVGGMIRDSECVNSAFECRYINMTTAKTLEDIGRGGARKYLSFLRLLVRVVCAVFGQPYDVVYVTPNSAGAPFYKDFVVVQTVKAALWLSGRRRKTTVLLHFHNKGVAARQDRRLDGWLYRRLFSGVKVMLLAEPLYTDIGRYVPRRDVAICHNGIADTVHAATPRHGQGGTRILFLSNLLVAKGVWVLLDALQRLGTQNWTCDFVGGETAEIDRAAFEAEVSRRGLDGRVRYLGRRYGNDKDECFARADLFVLPSFTEAFPLAVLEAMMHSLPVAATNVGGIPTQVQDGTTGLLCQAQDADSLAACLDRLVGDADLRQRMGQAGRQRFEERFTLATFETNFVRCLQSFCIAKHKKILHIV